MKGHDTYEYVYSHMASVRVPFILRFVARAIVGERWKNVHAVLCIVGGWSRDSREFGMCFVENR
jgi:hypothetical protein